MKLLAVAIFTAVNLEARAVAAAMGMSPPSAGKAVLGVFEGIRVSQHLIGIGGAGLSDVILADEPDYIVMAGVAGALDPALAVGDVVMGDCPPGVAEACGFRRGVIHSANALVSTPAQKAELFRSIGAVAVDMETAAVREWTARRGVGFIALRTISDSAAQELDPAVLGLVDSWGNPRPAKLARFLAVNPLRARLLIQLGRDSKFAAGQLGRAVAMLIRQIAVSRAVS